MAVGSAWAAILVRASWSAQVKQLCAGCRTLPVLRHGMELWAVTTGGAATSNMGLRAFVGVRRCLASV